MSASHSAGTRGAPEPSSDSDEDVDVINVEFDFQAPSEIDFQAMKRLFQQMFYTHAPQMDLGILADHVIQSGMTQGIGTVIKVDDIEQVHDPYAVISAVMLGPASPASELLQTYFTTQLSKAASAKPFLDLLKSASESKPHLFVLHERMINLPPQVMPPLLRMLLEEVDGSLRETASPKPSHLIIFSRAFSADALEEGNEEDEPTGLAGARKRKARGEHAHPDDAAAAALGKPVSNKKRAAGSHDDGLGSFHPEDELIREFVSHSYTYRFPAPPDAADSYETPLFGRLLAVPFSDVPALLQRLLDVWPPP
ncbi:Mss4p nuclear export [Malassezia caprae]|uniref:Mss4p nuclear export n=1 Tax=Malassezia caprae TaxID=1381934 RepID=A0AAF0E5S4_9BASI|nr:Mss4p nuclear export [Malassezia caprae]